MSQFNQKISNFAQYFGVRSKSYYHSEAPANYDETDQLAYYLDHSARADFKGEFDNRGIPIYSYGGKKYNLPVHSILYALGNSEKYRRTKSESNKLCLIRIAEWLSETQDERGGWKTGDTKPKFGLNEPFYSAMIQGMAISTLVRAALLSGQNSLIDNATKALGLFQIDVQDSGVCREIDGYLFYEEYPSMKKYHVLNGFIYSIWGLLDLIRYNDNKIARELWEEGLKTLDKWLPEFDMGYWSLYHIGDGMKNPATIPYHKLHIEQLKVMHAITGQKIFKEYADRWTVYLSNSFGAIRTLPQKLLWNFARGF